MRDGGLEVHDLPRAGMIEVETIGVQAEASDGIAAVAILAVALYGVTDVLHVHANLVLAPCL
jgi:hypothetical protein